MKQKLKNGTKIEKCDKIGNLTEFKIRQKLKIKQKIENWTKLAKIYLFAMRSRNTDTPSKRP